MTELNAGHGITFISAGFPSPAEDFTELSISLDKHLIRNPAATFMAYANGKSMVSAGIHHGDILIIDRSLNARDGDIIIALLYGEFTVKRYLVNKNQICLRAEGEFDNYPDIEISKSIDFEVWGVVTHTIHNHR